MQKDQGQNNVKVEVGLFGLEQGVRTLRNLIPGHKDTMAGFELHSSGFSTQAARPLGESREHLSKELQKRHFGPHSNIRIEIVHPDKADVLKVLVKGQETKQTSPAVLREYENGKIVISLSEAIFTSTLHSDPTKNADQQIKFAGRLIGMLLPRRDIELANNTISSRAAEWLSKDIPFGSKNQGNIQDDPERRLTAQSAIMYGCSVRHIVDMFHPAKIARYLSWEHISSKISRACANENLDTLKNTEKLYNEITVNKAGEFWSFTRGAFTQVEVPAVGSKLEALSSALAAIGSLGKISSVDTLGQALVLHYAQSTPAQKKSETSLFRKVTKDARSLAFAFEKLSEHSFEVPKTFEADRADLSLANLHQRFIQTVEVIADEANVQPQHLCAMYLTTAYVKSCHLEELSTDARDNAMYQVYLFDAALAQRLASNHLAEKLRYAVFSQCQTDELNSVREMLGGYLGLDMEAARNLERGMRNHLEAHADELEEKLGFRVESEVRLKGYLSLYEKLEEIKADLYGMFSDENETIASSIIQDLETAVKKYETGSIEEREIACETISKRWINFFTEYPQAQNLIRDFLDVTDCLGVRFICKNHEDLEQLTDSIDTVLRDQLKDRLTFDEGMTITGIREIGDEAVNSGDPRREKVSKGTVPWILRRYSIEITDQQSGEVKTWEMPIELQFITEDEHKKQRVGEEPRKYGFPHWWLKASRQVSNYLQKIGTLPLNRYCGVQISFQDADHDGSSLAGAFNAARKSITGLHLAVFDKEHWSSKEIVLSSDSTQQELLETMGLIPEQFQIVAKGSAVAVPRLAVINPGETYSIERLAVPLPYSIPRTPRGVLTKATFRSSHEELENLNRGGTVLNSILGNPFFDGAPRYGDLSDCLNDFVSPHFGLSNSRELASYLGTLQKILQDSSRDESLPTPAVAAVLMGRATERIKELVGYHFQFPQASVSGYGSSGELVVHLKRNTSSFMLEVAKLIPIAKAGLPYSVQWGNVSKLEDGGVEMKLHLDMPLLELHIFADRINGLALSKARESLLGGGNEANLELWLRDKPNTFFAVLEAAHSKGLVPTGFLMDVTSMRNEFIPFKEGNRSGMYHPTEWRFELYDDVDGSEQSLREALDDFMKILEDKNLVLKNTPSFVSQGTRFTGEMLKPYMRPDKRR